MLPRPMRSMTLVLLASSYCILYLQAAKLPAPALSQNQTFQRIPSQTLKAIFKMHLQS